MVMKMPRPFKANNGVFWLRVRIPKDLQTAFGGRQHRKKSLATKDPKVAEQRFAKELTAFRSKCENLRKGPQALTEREARRLAEPVFSRWVAEHSENPSLQSQWHTEEFSEMGSRPTYPSDDMVCAPGSVPGVAYGVPDLISFTMHPARIMKRIASDETKQLESEMGLILSETSHQRLGQAVACAIQRACLALERLERGEVSDIQIADAPSPAQSLSVPRKLKCVTFAEIFDGWKAEIEPRDKTVYEWKQKIKSLENFVQFADAQMLTRDHILQWKDQLIKAELSAKTINDSYLTAIRTVLRWGVENTSLASNAAQGVRVRRRQRLEGIRGFSDDEAAAILKAAASSKKREFRWLPLLQCYSGARLAEVSQLRREDIKQHQSFATMSFAFEAGDLKTLSSKRTVPLHPAIIEAGFLDFVAEIPQGPLFQDLRPNKFGSRGGTATKILGPWIRRIGIVDKQIAPTHSWRHRFKTLARRYGIPEEFSDTITGHAHLSPGRTYGQQELLDILYSEIRKIPTVTW